MQPEHEEVPYAQVFAATPAPLLVLTPDLVVCEANDAYVRAVGHSRDELLGRQMFEVFPESGDAAGRVATEVRASLERVRDTGRAESMPVQRYDIPGADGARQERYWSLVHAPVLDEDGRTMLLLHRAENVTDFVRARRNDDGHTAQEHAPGVQQPEADLFARAQELQALNAELRTAHQALAQSALHDPLTGLLIRPVILEQVRRALARTARYPRPVAVLFIDLDGLKQVNDSYGHAAGDDLIRCFADRLRSSVRPCDAVARFGGDEFVVLLEDLSCRDDAQSVATRILGEARSCALPGARQIRVSASIGLAVTGDEGMSPEELILSADQAMYAAKRSGGDGYRVFEPGVHPGV